MDQETILNYSFSKLQELLTDIPYSKLTEFCKKEKINLLKLYRAINFMDASYKDFLIATRICEHFYPEKRIHFPTIDEMRMALLMSRTSDPNDQAIIEELFKVSSYIPVISLEKYFQFLYVYQKYLDNPELQQEISSMPLDEYVKILFAASEKERKEKDKAYAEKAEAKKEQQQTDPDGEAQPEPEPQKEEPTECIE